MIIIGLLIIGFLLGSGVLGANIISAFDWAQYGLWLGAFFATFVASIIAGVGFIGGGKLTNEITSNKILNTIGVIAGGVLGSLVAFLVVINSYLLLWLSYYIMRTVPETATTISDIPELTQFAIVSFFVLLFLSIFKGFLSKK